MANLPETSTFDPGVYELQTTDLVLGGPSGPSNAAAINLTNRTRWLFDQNVLTVLEIASINAHLSTLDAEISTINGQIAGINANLASINGQLPLLAPLANPNFSGSPTAPTPGAFVNNSQLTTTAYIFNWYAPKASPNFTGSPTAPTPALGDSSTALATTAFANPNSAITGAGPWHRENPDGSIEQWGQFTYVTHSGGHLISFPVTFPNTVQGVWIETVAASIGWDTWVINGSIGNANFQINDDASSGNTVTIHWHAKGR
jgi:hypothetical protein